MTENEHSTGISTTACPQPTNWLAAGLALTGIGMLALAGAVGFAAWSLLVTASKIEHGVDAAVKQVATSATVYQAVIDRYKAAPPVPPDPFIVPESKSPFPE